MAAGYKNLQTELYCTDGAQVKRNVISRMVLAVISSVILLTSCTEKPQPEQAQVFAPARELAEFSLLDQTLQPVSKASLYNQWTLVFVGYTFCPDICPLTLAKLAGVHADLALMLKEPLKIWFVSVDPERDTPQQLAQYISYFDQPAILAMTAPHDQLFPFVQQLGLMYALGDATEEHYLVAHSASLALINPQGQLVALFKPTLSGDLAILETEILLQDFPKVLKLSN